ncbi:class I SAM-dependent methyltransferase [Caulobacter sp. Root1472]|uniref:class I SAM-dependent methyltransferase n=1 Tax=Caulobacter sp. Root1472 TaxID=1736470 RepID=UPI0006F8E10A|nr:class I SAM-dependent methyltransferase [Caulobacter sp. Root1472]KQZ18932.1 methyltransferase [Caulobacter sp. Root1472]
MSRSMISALVAACALAMSAAPGAAQVPANLTAALADPARPAADTARDAARHPAELLALANIKPGGKVADFIIGGGYFTRILSAAVGPIGTVYAYQPAEFIKFQAKYGEDLKTVAAAYKNVTPLDGSLIGLDLPDGLDAVITVQNYHDLHLKPFPADTAAKVNAEVFKSLKPGGVFLVVDHYAADGSGLSAPDTLHRVDVEAVKSEVQAAGFKLAAESPLLRNPADPRTASVFDPAIRGKTDQFVLKFVKP